MNLKQFFLIFKNITHVNLQLLKYFSARINIIENSEGNRYIHENENNTSGCNNAMRMRKRIQKQKNHIRQGNSVTR